VLEEKPDEIHELRRKSVRKIFTGGRFYPSIAKEKGLQCGRMWNCSQE